MEAQAMADRPPVVLDTQSTITERTGGGGLLRSTPIFVLGYFAFMVPTYVLPYLGSNSTLLGVASLAFGFGPSPMWWLHVWALATLCLMSWTRGAVVGRGWLPILPIIAAFFDMTPGLTAVPLVPSVMHILAIILGVVSGAPSSGENVARTSRKAFRAFLLISALAAAGIAFFFARPWWTGSARSPVKPPPAEIMSNQPPSVSRQAPTKPSAPIAPPQAVAPAVNAIPKTAPPPSAQQPVSPQVPSNPTTAAKSPIRIPPKDAGTTRQVEQTSSAATAIAGMIEDAETCMARKKYDCAIASAKSALRVSPGNIRASDILRRAETEQQRALDSIYIR